MKTTEITPNKSLFDIKIKELFQFKDLLFLFVKRDFISIYKQTILGPLWFFIQPLLTTIIFTIVFGNIAGISTDGVPQILFYLSGLTCWNYFSECLTKTSNTFVDNQDIFGKVFFPRLITPLSTILSGLLKFGIQFLLFLGFYFYFVTKGEINFTWNYNLLLFPIIIGIMSLNSLGFGLIISSLTTKYRDFRFLIQFGIQLWMYATPIIYPLSTIDGKLATIVKLNPLTGITETFKTIFLGVGEINYLLLGYSFLFTIFVLIIGTLIFNKTEQNFMDTI